MNRRIWAVLSFGSFFALLHCGGTVEVVPGAGGASAEAGAAGLGHAGRSGQAGHTSSVAGAAAGSEPTDAGFDVYADPGCPDAGMPVRLDACDPFSANSGCGAGLGCYPYVNHPVTDCGVQTFGAECRPSGVGQQGDACDGNQEGCASGYVCVVGGQPGAHCVQLCPIGVANTCPAGLICGDLDVEGFGVCS